MANRARTAGMATGLAVAAGGSAALLAGYLPPYSAGLVAIVAIGVIVGTRRWFRATAEK